MCCGKEALFYHAPRGVCAAKRPSSRDAKGQPGYWFMRAWMFPSGSLNQAIRRGPAT